MSTIDDSGSREGQLLPALVSAVLLLGIGGVLWVDHVNGTVRAGVVDQTIAFYVVAFVGFVAAVWLNERRAIDWRVIWAVAIVARLLLLFTTPTLSDDVYRYLWEGHLLSEGVSPYQAPIFDPALDPYSIPARSLVNNPTLASPYLPMAHAVFALSAALFPSEPITMQIVMVLLELTAAALLVVLLRVVGAKRERILLWLWNPLVIVEVAHGAHLDALMIALTLGALVLAVDPQLQDSKSGRIGAPVLLALATLTRPIPVLLVPVLFWRWNWTQRVIYGATLVGAVVPFALWSGLGLGTAQAGVGVFGSSRSYTETFRFNTAIYQSLEQWIGSQGLDDRGWNEPMALTRLVVAIAFVSFMLWLWFRARSVVTPLATLRMMMIPIGAYVLLTPVFHPWYALLLFALLIFQAPVDGEPPTRWLTLVPWGWLAAATSLSYLTYRDPFNFAESAWVRRVEWWPVLIVGAAVLVSRRRLYGATTSEVSPGSLST